MKLNYLIRVSLIVCIVLLCAGFAVYSFVRLDAMDERRNFDLYTLIPQDVEAVFETDCAVELIERIDNMACSRDQHFLYVSELFSCIKKYLRVLMEKEPHGLSWEMNEILISFHKPDVKNDQVLYCRLSTDDRELLGTYIRRYGMSGFSPKTFDYKGQAIDIYPLEDGRFLAVWMKRDFLVVSFQKRLVERVIETWKRKESLARLETFSAVGGDRHEENKAVIYVRWENSSTSIIPKEDRSQPLWLSFNLKLAEEGIYCAGIVHGDVAADTCCHALLEAHPLAGFGRGELPGSTFLYKSRALSAAKVEVDCALRLLETDSTFVAANEAFDKKLATYLRLEAGQQMQSSYFLSNDSLDRQVYMVLSFSMKDTARAQWELHRLLYELSQGRYPFYKSFAAATGVSRLRLYRLPNHRLTSLLSGYDGDGPSFTCACFYRGRLLLSPNEQSLIAYVTSLELGDVLESLPFYEVATEKLAPTYQALMMADMEEVLLHPDLSRDLLPPFFLAHADFFRHFLLSIQLCYAEGVVYPSLVLLYVYPEVPME